MKLHKLFVAFAVLLVVAPVQAHHAMEVHYLTDEAAILTHTGVVKNFTLLNPHSWLVVTVTEGNLSRDWVLEAQSGTMLSRAGWRFDLLKQGAVISFSAFPARVGGETGRLLSLEVGGYMYCSDRCDLVGIVSPEVSGATTVRINPEVAESF